jgi:hypothetical protein
MKIWKSLLLAGTMLATCTGAWAGQAPGALSSPDIPISHHDRVCAAEQISNTVSVTDPVDKQAPRSDQTGRFAVRNFQPALQGSGSRPWPGVFA